MYGILQWIHDFDILQLLKYLTIGAIMFVAFTYFAREWKIKQWMKTYD